MAQTIPIGKTLLNVITKQSPLYVQYYVTARCNFRCQQCNVIYANADRRELSTEDAIKTIENLGKIGTSVLLLTGGEPFVRSDLPELAKAAISNNMHVRIQTNGLANPEALRKCVEYGVTDISISLDSLQPSLQDFLNGDVTNSWQSTLETISNVSNIFPPESFAVFGCVISPFNYLQIPNIIKFATKIGWWVSLVPAHKTDSNNPRSFSSFNDFLGFDEYQIAQVIDVVDTVIALKKQGLNIYDSEQYLHDIKNYISNTPVTWRNRNSGKCDAGSMYFAVLPDGAMAPCCDYRYSKDHFIYDKLFPKKFMKNDFFKESDEIADKCSGCLYGSYPEITITARFMKAGLERFRIFKSENNTNIQRYSALELNQLAKEFS